MTFCGKCGTRNPDDNKYCEKCGARLNTRLEQQSEEPGPAISDAIRVEIPVEPHVEPYTEAHEETPEPSVEPKPHKAPKRDGFAQKHTALAAAIAALAITGLILLACVDWNPDSDEDDGWTDVTGIISMPTPDGTYNYTGKITYNGVSEKCTVSMVMKGNDIVNMTVNGKSVDLGTLDPSELSRLQHKDSPDWEHNGMRYHADLYRIPNGSYVFTIANQMLVDLTLKTPQGTLTLTLDGWYKC